MFSGEFGQFLGSMAFPGALGIMLLLLPFFDRNPERNIFRRPFALIGWVVLTVSILLFTVSAIINREFLD
jgi:ubiquinol-cytochrome c reductase cytochrome b subunit